MTGCSASVSVRARACVRVRAAPGGHAVRERRRIGDYKEKQYHCAARLRALRCCGCASPHIHMNQLAKVAACLHLLTDYQCISSLMLTVSV